MHKLLDLLFGCSHQRYTFPITPAYLGAKTYVACLDCGREFEYDWQNMRVVGEYVPPKTASQAHAVAY
jgi:hypothetical protein